MRIFMSYRRADSQTITERIHDFLENAFGEKALFKDVNDIPIGKDFREIVADAIAESDVMLFIIGPNWLGAMDDTGKRRLDNEDDPVRFELQTALDRSEDLLIIPVLVQGAQMPPNHQLPEPLRHFTHYNAATIRNDPDFRTDIDKLIKTLREQQVITQSKHPKQTDKREYWLIGAVIAVAVIVGIIMLLLSNQAADTETALSNTETAQALALTEEASPTDVPTETDTPEPTATDTSAPTATDTDEPSETPTPEPSATDVPTEADTPEPTATNTPTETETTEPTATDTTAPTATDTLSPKRSIAILGTASASDTPTVELPSDTPEPTATDTASPTDTATDVPSATLTATHTSTPTNVPEPCSIVASQQDVRVHAGPGRNRTVVRFLTANRAYVVSGIATDNDAAIWLKIVYNGLSEAWVMQSDVRMVGDCFALPLPATATESDTDCEVIAQADDVRVHAGPGRNRAVVRLLIENETYTVVDARPDSAGLFWWQVAYAGLSEAWVMQSDVTTQGDCSLFAVETTPTPSPSACMVIAQADDIRVYAGPGRNRTVIRLLTENEEYDVTNQQAVSGVVWYQVEFRGVSAAWVASEDVQTRGVCD